MSEIITVGLDLAKNVFQAHGVDASGRSVLRKTLRRGEVLAFLSQLPPCVVAMEACGGAHFWGREIGKLGHEVRLIPPACVKPFVKRQKNDAADAEEIPRTEGRKKPAKPRKDERGNPLNHHVHILCPTRVWDEKTQSFGKKIRDIDDVKTGPECVRQMREEWQRRVNRHLEKAGVAARVDLRSYEAAAAAGDAPEGLVPQPKLGPRNTARGRRRELETGRDDTFLGQVRARTRAANDELWESWLILRDAERERARLEKSQRIAAETEAARRLEAGTAEAKIAASETAEARAEAIAAAPHLDALDPQQAAIAWAEGRLKAEIDPQSDKTLDPETDTATVPETGQPPKFIMSEREKKRARPPRQRQRRRGGDG